MTWVEPGRGPLPGRARTLAEIRECKQMGLWRLAASWEYHLRWLDWYEGVTPTHPGPAPAMFPEHRRCDS